MKKVLRSDHFSLSNRIVGITLLLTDSTKAGKLLRRIRNLIENKKVDVFYIHVDSINLV